MTNPRFSKRRAFLKTSLALSAYSFSAATSLIAPIETQAEWMANLFSLGTFDESIQKSFSIPDVTQIEVTDKIELKLPSIAENGAVVPLTINTTLERVEQFFVFVEKNPVPLVAVFNLSPQVEPTASLHVKLSETSEVVVVAKAAGQLYKIQQTVKVTIGGCGG